MLIVKEATAEKKKPNRDRFLHFPSKHIRLPDSNFRLKLPCSIHKAASELWINPERYGPCHVGYTVTYEAVTYSNYEPGRAGTRYRLRFLSQMFLVSGVSYRSALNFTYKAVTYEAVNFLTVMPSAYSLKAGMQTNRDLAKGIMPKEVGFFINTEARMTEPLKTHKDGRHLGEVLEERLRTAGDVERNPGPEDEKPATKLKLITQNCRGIAEEKKFKHLLNNCYKISKDTENFVIALQETMIRDEHKIKYGWRGTHTFTPGSGHGRGCITLMPAHVQPDPDTVVQLGQRGHIFKASMGQSSVLIANIYSPTGHTREKIDFFEKLRLEITRLREPGDEVYLMGDFNTVFEPYEIRARSYSLQEQRHSAIIKQILDSLALEDAWQQNKSTHTWRQPGTLKTSRLDRIYHQSNLKFVSIATDWSFTNSDHAAVVATYTDGSCPSKQKILRLNPTLLQSEDTRNAFLNEYRAQIQQIPESWNPHQKLEFHKCAIRSSYIAVATEAKRRKQNDYDFVKEDLHAHIKLLEEGVQDMRQKNRIMNKINQLKANITKLNLQKGQKLADRLKTKWYNEGERSNKYFLALLRKKEVQGQLNELEVGGRTETDQEKIEQHITTFYSELYNQNLEQSTREEMENLIREMVPLNQDEIGKINQPLTLEVLSRTLKNISDSCPGPDGIPYSYLKVTWTWFGPILLDSWHYSILTKNLPDSHKASWLRLIPKGGKNLKELKNWRPITLSNCDHKIITKALSTKLAENCERIISGNQTAYLRGRSISDNLRIVTLANKISNQDRQFEGLLIALDAQKAFDSVSHGYIKKVLTKIGLEDFVEVFETLYDGNKVEIMINGKICKGYSVKNGVKQGDALSCILFILAMEPLLRNIESNGDIGILISRKYNLSFPKCIGYADDINILTNNSIMSLRNVIKEYEKFTKISGLKLNADKTEVFKIAHSYTAHQYSFLYQGQRTVVTNTEIIKINGLVLSTDPDESHRLNFESVKSKVDSQLAAWSYRGLTLLGKILIYKTFGLSQIIYITRVMKFTDKENKILRNMIYKFLWNRNYQTNKAPDRIKRKYLTTEIRKGGFGMVDHERVIEAMNARQVLVNLTGNHPLKEILKQLITNADSHFNSDIKEKLEGPSENYCEVMNKIHRKLLMKDLEYLQQDRLAQEKMLREKLIKIVRPDRRNSIEMLMLRNQGTTTVRQLLANQAAADHFRLRLLHFSYSTIMDACLTSPIPDPVNDLYIPIKGRYKMATHVTSRDLRTELLDENETGVDSYKLALSEIGIEKMLRKVRKLSSVRQKNLALRLIHGDIFTYTKLFKLGLSDSDECSKCRQRETLEHVIKGCWYNGAIWSKVHDLYKVTDTRVQLYDKHSLEFSVGALLSMAKLKLHLEIIRRLVGKERPSLLPRMLIQQSLDYLIICDTNHQKYYRKLRNAIIAT